VGKSKWFIVQFALDLGPNTKVHVVLATAAPMDCPIRSICILAFRELSDYFFTCAEYLAGGWAATLPDTKESWFGTTKKSS